MFCEPIFTDIAQDISFINEKGFFFKKGIEILKVANVSIKKRTLFTMDTIERFLSRQFVEPILICNSMKIKIFSFLLKMCDNKIVYFDFSFKRCIPSIINNFVSL